VAGTTTDHLHSEDVKRRIRRDIFAGRRKPGSGLTYRDLGTSYDASPGSVREALADLVRQGLVRKQVHRGHIVTPLSKDDLTELVAARLTVEPAVLRTAVANGDVQWEARVLATHHALARTPKFDDVDPTHAGEDWAARHTAFHAALLSGCRNERLVATTRRLAAEACLYWRWAIPLESPHDVAAEHEGLLDAAIARDADLAAERLSAHIVNAALLLLNHASSRSGIRDSS
jgi:DNA-binding GntR family transcriptional regulator